MTTLVTTILCGGAGSRLWPLSRSEHPKPFIKVDGDKNLLQHTIERASRAQTQHTLIVTNESLLFKVNEVIEHSEHPDNNCTYILEPFPKNTAGAVASAVVQTIRDIDEDAVMLVLSADHMIADESAFQAAVNKAVALAVQGRIVTFGIHPERPETGFGYLHVEGDTVVDFIEKPSREMAETYLQSDDYYWNGGIFCFKAGIMQQEMQKHCPQILEQARLALTTATETRLGDNDVHRLNPEYFIECEETSIDYAVMEKVNNLAVVPCDIGWVDVGSWQAMSELQQADDLGNVIKAEVNLHNVSNSYFYSEDRLVAAAGVDNLVVVDTADALLIVDKNHTQQVKHLFQSLKKLDHPTHRAHNQVFRPWGSYTILADAAHYKVKRIEVKPGASLSLQSHRHRSEHWVVLQGRAHVINDSDEFSISKNESTFIRAGRKHRLSNADHDQQLVIIEVQTGEYVGEDDIERYEDRYGRVY